MTTWISHTPEDTRALGAALGRLAVPGTIVALVGDLGAGKTVVAKGVGQGLGVTSRIQSPTFILVQTHRGGRLPLWHADLYRLGDASELDQLGLDEMLEGQGVMLVEWADRFEEVLPADRLVLQLQGDDDERTITIEATGPRHRALLETLIASAGPSSADASDER